MTTATYEVTATVLVEVKVKLLVEADGKDAAIDAFADAIPMSPAGAYRSSSPWKASVTLTPPKGAPVSIQKATAVAVYAASGGETAKKVTP